MNTQQRYIGTALESSDTELNIIDFARVVGFTVDLNTFVHHFEALNEDKWVLVNRASLDYIGYSVESGDALRNASRKVTDILSDDFKSTDYKVMNNAEFTSIWNADIKHETPNQITKLNIETFGEEPKLHGNKQHILITMDTLKELSMTVINRKDPNKSRQKRRYFVAVENLIITYFKYQLTFRQQNIDIIIIDIKSDPIIQQQRRVLANNHVDVLTNTKNKIGIVYFVHLGDDLSHFKIGYTYDMNTRLADLQVGNWERVLLYKFVYSIRPNELETSLHVHFADKRIRGEWFGLTTSEVDQICEILKFE